jgi:hypothetical protein
VVVQQLQGTILVLVDPQARTVREDVAVGARGRFVAQTVALQVVGKLGVDRGAQKEVLIHRVEVVDEAGAGDLPAHHRAPDLLVAFEHERLPTSPREIKCAHQAVVPGSDYYRVVPRVGHGTSLEYFYRSPDHRRFCSSACCVARSTTPYPPSFSTQVRDRIKYAPQVQSVCSRAGV